MGIEKCPRSRIKSDTKQLNIARFGLKPLGYDIFEKSLQFSIRKSQWEFDFLAIYLLFSSVP